MPWQAKLSSPRLERDLQSGLHQLVVVATVRRVVENKHLDRSETNLQSECSCICAEEEEEVEEEEEEEEERFLVGRVLVVSSLPAGPAPYAAPRSS
jgi:hypothetical protein